MVEFVAWRILGAMGLKYKNLYLTTQNKKFSLAHNGAFPACKEAQLKYAKLTKPPRPVVNYKITTHHKTRIGVELRKAKCSNALAQKV